MWELLLGIDKLISIIEMKIRVNTISFSPDGYYLASGSRDNTIKLWNIETKIRISDLLNEFTNLEKIYKNMINEETPELFRPKGEFETTEEYNKRIKLAELKKKEIKNKYDQKLSIEREKIRAQLSKLMDNIYTEKVNEAILDKYNADKEIFPLTIEGDTQEIRIPRAEAREFKDDFDNHAIIKDVKYSITDNDELIEKTVGVKIKTTYGKIYTLGKAEEMTSEYVKKPPEPPLIKILSLRFNDDNNDNFLEGNENGEIQAEIVNNGRGTAYGLTAKLEQKENYPFLDYIDQQFIQELKPDERKIIEFNILAKDNTPPTTCDFTIEFDETNGFFPDPVNLSFHTKEYERPNFLIEKGIEDRNGNLEIEQQEIVKLTLRLGNTGGDARNVSLTVEKGDNVFLTGDSKVQYSFNTINRGEYRDISFSFYTNKRIKDEIPLSVVVESDHFDKEFPLGLKIKQREISPQNFVFTGKEIEKSEIKIPGIAIDIEQNIPRTKSNNNHAIAVIIGNRDYIKKDIPPVDYAIRDASIVKKYLTNTFGYREGNIIYVQNASQADFNSIFGTESNYKGKLYNYIKSGESDVFIYYSGHGAPNIETKNGFFMPVDCDPSTVALNGYSLSTFYHNLYKINYRSLTVVIDACFSGSSEKGMLIDKVSPVFIEVKNPDITISNSVVFTSATGEQISSWYPDKRHSLFTYYFLKGLGGDADHNNDREILVSEMKEYIDENVPYMARRLNSREQTPQVFGDKNKVIIEY